jgi:hypothetical protein
MKAVDFIRKFGLNKARKIVIGYSGSNDYIWYHYNFDEEYGKQDSVNISDLKKFTDAYELVQSKGGYIVLLRYFESKHISSWDSLDGKLIEAMALVEEVGECDE